MKTRTGLFCLMEGETEGMELEDRKRTRNRRGAANPRRETATKAQGQTNALTFQILLVVALLLCAWCVKRFQPDWFGTVSRIYRSILTGPGEDDPTIEEIQLYLKERLPFSVPDLPFTIGSSGTVLAMGGVYQGILNTEKKRTIPSGVCNASLYLSAQPRVPVAGMVTSAFGWRENPLVPGEEDFHTGVDIAAAEGSPIFASLPGIVEETGFSSSYGNYIHILHVNGLRTDYAHCSEIIAQAGEVIRQGERIALVGSTGNVTGPHLHFEIRQDTLAYDPLRQLLRDGDGP